MRDISASDPSRPPPGPRCGREGSDALMSRIAYVNGRFVPHAQAVVHIEDRGYQLADGVYEVWAVFDGRLADAAGHFTRLARSLGELRIAAPMSDAALKILLAETLRRNRVTDGLVYLQVTRGVARRSLLAIAAAAGLTLEERPFTVEEARGAREAFITGAGTLVMPVVRVDGRDLGDGAPGPVAKRLRELYIEAARGATQADALASA